MAGMDKMALWKEQSPEHISDIMAAVSLGTYISIAATHFLLLHHAGPGSISISQASRQYMAGYRHHPPLPFQPPQIQKREAEGSCGGRE